MSPGRGPGAGGSCNGRGRASDRQPWRPLSWRGNRGSERGSHLPKVTQQGDVGALAFQAYSSASENATAKDGGTHQAGVPAPQDSPATEGDPWLVQQNSQGPLSTQPHRRSASHRLPRPSRLSARAAEWSGELNKPGTQV